MGFHPDGLLVVPRNVAVVDVREPVATGATFFSKVSGPLFTGMPSAADVRQGAIGDCYLLAAVNSILTRADGPEVILGMMKDQGNGSIIFRFFVDGVAKYVRTPKTFVAKPIGVAISNRGANWPAILEKVYAAFLRGGVYHSKKLNDEKKDIGLAGGEPNVALGHLTGQGSKQSANNIFGELLMMSVEMAGAKDGLPEAKRRVSEQIFPKDGPDYPNAARWAQWNVKQVKNELFGFQFASPTTEKFRELLDRLGKDLHAETKSLVLAWASGVNLSAGAIGSGIYTPQQLDLFAKVQRWLATQRSVAASTKEKLQGPVTGRGHSGGEDEVAGLYGGHAYSVLDTRVDEKARRYLLLRNPHGTGFFGKVRTYTETTPGVLVAKQSGGAESWIELTDFCNNFEANLAVGAPVHGAARQGLMTNLTQQLKEQKTMLKDTAPPPPPLGLGRVKP